MLHACQVSRETEQKAHICWQDHLKIETSSFSFPTNTHNSFHRSIWFTHTPLTSIATITTVGCFLSMRYLFCLVSEEGLYRQVWLASNWRTSCLSFPNAGDYLHVAPYYSYEVLSKTISSVIFTSLWGKYNYPCTYTWKQPQQRKKQSWSHMKSSEKSVRKGMKMQALWLQSPCCCTVHFLQQQKDGTPFPSLLL